MPSHLPTEPNARTNSANRAQRTTELGVEYNFEESIGYWMVFAAQAFQKALASELAPHGITFRQCQVLGWLVLEGEMPQVVLAGHMMIEPATLVGVLKRMERDQLISRSTTSADRRQKLVRVHPEAREVWKKVVCCARKVRQRAIAGLSPSQVNTLKKSLRTVLGNLS